MSAAAATLKAGETYSYTYTAPDGKLIDTVAGIAAADYTVAADGKSVAISFKVKDKTDIAIALKNEPAAPETRTLTLDSTLNNAKVWSADGKTLISSSASTAFGTEYQVAGGHHSADPGFQLLYCRRPGAGQPGQLHRRGGEGRLPDPHRERGYDPEQD